MGNTTGILVQATACVLAHDRFRILAMSTRQERRQRAVISTDAEWALIENSLVHRPLQSVESGSTVRRPAGIQLGPPGDFRCLDRQHPKSVRKADRNWRPSQVSPILDWMRHRQDRRMTMRHSTECPGSECARQRDALVEQAFARLGVREMLETYDHWLRQVAVLSALSLSTDPSI